MRKVALKMHRAVRYPVAVPREIHRDLRAWKALAGIWRGRKVRDPVRWQRTIRKEWVRKLP